MEWSDKGIILIPNVWVVLHNMVVKMHLQGELNVKGLQEYSAGLVDEFFLVPAGGTSQNIGEQSNATHGSEPAAELASLIERHEVVTHRPAHKKLYSALN